MENHKNFDTVSEAINDLQQRGYTDDIAVEGNKLSCKGKDVVLNPDDFQIDEFYRFEGNSDPGDEMIVYAVSSASKGIKGVLVNAFGTYSDTAADDLISKLKIKREL